MLIYRRRKTSETTKKEEGFLRKSAKLMKAIVSKPKEIVLYYCLAEEKAEGLKKLSEDFGFSVKEITFEFCGQQLGFLADWKGFSENCEAFSPPPQRECLIFCGIDRGKMNRLLSEIRSRGLAVDLKAVATAANQSWRFCDLLCEIIKEHNQMHGI